MKLLSSLTLAALSLFPFALHAQSTNDLVRVEVRVKNTTERKEIKGSRADEKTQNVTLEVILNGKAREQENRVVKWAIFGKDVADKDLKVLESGEEKLALVSGAQKFETKTASTTSTPEHATASKGGGGGRGRTPQAKKVAGTGTKYAGWGVQVKDGDKTVGEQYSAPSLKTEMK